MKKYITAVILVLLLVIWILSNGVYSVSTDKTVYSSGEPVKIRWLEIKLLSCSNDPSIEIYRQEGGEWKQIKNDLIGFGATCVDGEFRYPAMPGDVIFCDGPSAKQGEYTWDGKFYDYKGTVDTCESAPEGFNGTFESYEHVNAPAGNYKVKLGSAESFFEIK